MSCSIYHEKVEVNCSLLRCDLWCPIKNETRLNFFFFIYFEILRQQVHLGEVNLITHLSQDILLIYYVSFMEQILCGGTTLTTV